MAKILCFLHGYPPQQNAGAEYYVKEMNAYLLEQGHSICVYIPSTLTLWGDIVTGWENQDTWPLKNRVKAEDLFEWADVVITHLDWSQSVTNLCQKQNKPCINIIHHNWEIEHLRLNWPNVYCVYNSEWVMKDRAYPHRSLVVRPPVNPARFDNVEYNPDGYITLVNCNKDKGALVFQDIARACPDLKFLAVKGHHGPQIELRGKNITQWECQEDIRRVFEQTSILLVPSVYESYGRIGIEAMACGIPVIASDTPGLRESLDWVGCFTSRNFIPGWLQSIRTVQGVMNQFPVQSEACIKHANTVWQQSLSELNQLNDLINEITS